MTDDAELLHPPLSPPLSQTRWHRERTEQERREYAARFAGYVADGTDVDGEARFVDALAARGSTVLDAGCGTGRLAAALVARGHLAVGVDADPVLVEAARAAHPDVPVHVADLTLLDAAHLDSLGAPVVFDLVVAAGNVLVYVEPGSEPRVLRRLAALLAPGGRAVFGFATDREYRVEHLDRDAAAVGWSLEHRFATWHLDPFTPDADWAVSVFRAPSLG